MGMVTGHGGGVFVGDTAVPGVAEFVCSAVGMFIGEVASFASLSVLMHPTNAIGRKDNVNLSVSRCNGIFSFLLLSLYTKYTAR